MNLEETSIAQSTIRIRSLLARVLVATIISLVIIGLGWPDWLDQGSSDMPLPDSLVGLLPYVLIAGFLYQPAAKFRFALIASSSAMPSKTQFLEYVALAIPLVAASAGSVYLLFYPLTFLAPEFVEAWLLEPISYFYKSDLHDAVVGNTISVVSIVLVAPIVEEFVFRGFLLSRLAEKYGIKIAVALSSIAFGILHQDVIGGAVFGLILSLITLRTGSLLMPILVHIMNNLISVVLMSLEFILAEGPVEYSIEEFRSYWWIGAFGAVVSVPWLIIFTKRLLSGKLDRTRVSDG